MENNSSAGNCDRITSWNRTGDSIYACDGNEIDGRSYLEMTSGLFNVSLGYSERIVSRAIYDQARKLPYLNPSFECSIQTNLAHKLIEMCDNEFSKVFICCGGSEAVEIAIRIAFHFTQKHGVICLRNAYHGDIGLSRYLSYETVAPPNLINNIKHVDPPKCNQFESLGKNQQCNAQCLDVIESELASNKNDVGLFVLSGI